MQGVLSVCGSYCTSSAVSRTAGLCDLRQVANFSECFLSFKDRVIIKLSPSLTFQKTQKNFLVSSKLLTLLLVHLSGLANMELCNVKLCQQRALQGQQEEGPSHSPAASSASVWAVHPPGAPQHRDRTAPGTPPRRQATGSLSSGP